MMFLRSTIVAVIIFIPLASIQHFISPVSYCTLAALCNHSWIPVCAWDIKTDDYSIFTDECDVYEFNCDRKAYYHLVKYADCFNPSLSTTTPCPVLDKLMTKILGYYIFKPNGAKTVYVSTTKRTKATEKTKVTVKSTTKRTNATEKTKVTDKSTTKRTEATEKTNVTDKTTKAHRMYYRRYSPEKTGEIKATATCSPCERNKRLLAELEAKEWTMKRVVKSTTKKKRSSRPVKKSQTQATIVLKKETVWKNGRMMQKVVKGFKPMPKKPKTTKPKNTPQEGKSHDDSDFLVNLA